MFGQKLNRWTWLVCLALVWGGCEGAATDDDLANAQDEPTQDVASASEEQLEADVALEASDAEAVADEGDASESDAASVADVAEGFGPDIGDFSEGMAEEEEGRPEGASLDLGVPFSELSAAQDVVAFVDVDRYMGRWYEIATTPSFQQASCYATQADYTFNDAQGWVDVLNACRVGSTMGNWQQIAGRAELVDTETQAKLNVIFFGQSAPYWVVALDGTEGDEPYQWAVVSVPGKQVIWILSRTNQMAPELRAEIEAHLLERGFPVDTLLNTPHAE